MNAESNGRAARLRRGGAVIDMTSTEPIEIEPAVWWPDMGVELPTRRLVLRLAPNQTAVTTQLRITYGVTGAIATL